MATATLTAPVADASTGGGDIDHLYCWCDPDVALCGVDLTGLAFVDPDDEYRPTCPLCVLAMESRCRTPGCQA